jgi:UDP-N-acetylmuramoyl-L-alanyl-D-glutamate--2,6-diaminopimelate ligase
MERGERVMRFWGITGTNGKTTTAWIFAEFVNSVPGRSCGYITTVEVFDGKRRFSTGYTTPPYAQIKEIVSQMEANGCTDCVMEVSSHAIHQHRTGDIVFSGGIFTNLSEDHLDYHKTMEEYFRVKLSFVQMVASSCTPTPDKGRADLPPFVVCLDGESGREMFNAAGNLPVNVIASKVSSSPYDLSNLPLVGEYNKANVLAAAALAEKASVPRENIQNAIPRLYPRWGRLEKVSNENVAADVYVDFAHTPDGLEKVLSASRGFTRNNLWVVFGAGGDRDKTKRPLMGEVSSRLADKVVITSDNPRSEEPQDIIRDILAGVANVERCEVESDRTKAIHLALSNAKEGDVIIIAGKGHETYQEIKGVKYPFNDALIVSEFTK